MISKFSVRKPYTVLVGVIMAIVLGVVSFTRMTADLLPSINLPYVIVLTTYIGASPESVETVVTKPIESSMATVSNIENISSTSSENYSMVMLEFAQSANMDSVSLEIRENLDQLESVWEDEAIGSPIIMKLNPDMMPVMIAAAGMEGKTIAQVSTYAKENLIPDIESIEGVASATATGLIEESVNVIIRQEKIDKVNEQVFAAIDEKMAEAEQELADGKKEALKGQKELVDAKNELVSGEKEINDGKAELESGKQTLKNKQAETAAQLATTKTQLLTAKADLEATKMALTTDLAVVENLNKGLKQAKQGLEQIEQGLQQLQTGIDGITVIKDQIWAMDAMMLPFAKDTILAGIPDEMADMKAVLEAADWTKKGEYDDTDTSTVMGAINSILNPLLDSKADLEGKKTEVDAKIAEVEAAISAKTNTLSVSDYKKMINAQLAEIDKNLETVDNGLTELEKGSITAVIEFGNASGQISLGEYQLDTAKSQLESAKSEIENGEQQIKDALEQIKDGEQQLADAKEDAYEQADMNGVLTSDTVKSLLTAQNFSMPAGYVTEEGVQYLIRVGDKPQDLEELTNLPLINLHMDGVDVIRLSDVADVFYTDNSDEVYTNVNGNAGIILSIQKQTGYSTGEVSDKLLDKFKEMEAENDSLQMVTLMDQGIYIDLVMDSILNNILFGAALAILILILFLRDLRPTFIIACSIPISLVTAIVCMYFSSVTLNVISLSGLALGIGMLVDNSIVVIENIYRLRSLGVNKIDAAIEGAKEVAGAILASTLTTVCVFLPIVFTEGITRQLFVDMGLTIAYSILASLVIALTVVPAMASKMLNKTKEQSNDKFFEKLVKGYSRVLEAALKIKPVVLILVVVLLVVSVLAAISNGTAFMPEMDSTQLSVAVTMEEGTPLNKTREVTDQVVEIIRSFDDVLDVGAMTGGSGYGAMLGVSTDSATDATDIYVTTKENKILSNEELAAAILEKTQDLDATITVETSTMDMSALGGSGITIIVKGKELETLQDIANRAAAVLETVEGIEQVSDGMEDSTEELRISVDKEKAMDYSLTVAQVFAQIAPKLADASNATTLVTQSKDYGVYVLHGGDSSLTRELVKELTVEGTNEDGETEDIPLADIVTFETRESLSSINRSAQTRYIGVSASIADGYNIGLVSSDVDRAFEDFEVPAGYSLEFSGENETINEAMEQVGLMLILALVFMYLIMVAQFQSLLSPFIIMFTIPLAFTGGFLGLYVSNSEVSVIAMIGFVMLAGIIVNNGIVLIDYINQLRENGMAKKEAIIMAGRTRLRPVLMTALTTILALSTMAFSDDMGADMAKPMSVVTIGGLIYGTLLTLIVIPCIYDIMNRDKKVKVEDIQSATIREEVTEIKEKEEKEE